MIQNWIFIDSNVNFDKIINYSSVNSKKIVDILI